MKKTLLITLSFLLSINLLSAQEDTKLELKPALVVMDVQNAYIGWMDEADKDIAIKYINAVIALFEKYQLPIIRVYHQDKNWGPSEDSEEFKFVPELNIKEEYPMIIKNYGNAFKKTDLDKILKDKNINTVFLCGLSATGCVLATHFGATDLDYDAFMIENALLSNDKDNTDSIEKIMNSVSYGDLNFIFKYTQ